MPVSSHLRAGCRRFHWQSEFVSGDKNWLDVRRNALQAIERALERRPDDAQIILQLLCTSVVALGFESEQIVRQIAHTLLELFQIQRIGAVLVPGDAALVHQVIELDRHALAVSIVQAEAQSAE